MSAQRDGMTLDGTSAPVVGVEERSDEAPRCARQGRGIGGDTMTE